MVVGEPEPGIIQDPNVSAKTEEVIANPNAQNADTILIKPLPFVLFIGFPFTTKTLKNTSSQPLVT
jgi:hypothetical protein